MGTTTYVVEGMTCEHCVAAVRKEVSSIAGVREVEVDLASGDVTVSSDEVLDRSVVAEAVDHAGYRLQV